MRRQGIDVVAEEFDAHRHFFGTRPDFDGVAANTELAAFERDVVALVLHVDKLEQ